MYVVQVNLNPIRPPRLSRVHLGEEGGREENRWAEEEEEEEEEWNHE